MIADVLVDNLSVLQPRTSEAMGKMADDERTERSGLMKISMSSLARLFPFHLLFYLRWAAVDVMEQLGVHSRGKVVPAAAGSEPNATVIRVGEASARAVQQEMMWQHEACWEVLALSRPSVPSWWSVGDHKQELRVPKLRNSCMFRLVQMQPPIILLPSCQSVTTVVCAIDSARFSQNALAY